GIAAGEQVLTLHDLYTADECFLTGSGAELGPVGAGWTEDRHRPARAPYTAHPRGVPRVGLARRHPGLRYDGGSGEAVTGREERPMPPSHPERRRVASRRVYEGRRVSVRLDEVSLPSGRTVVYEVVEHPGAAAIVALTSERHVLLVRQFRQA